MDAPSLTRRRALALGAAAGLSSVLSRAVPSAWARTPAAAAAPRGFGLTVARGAFDAQGRTGVLRAPRRFDLLGVRDGLAGAAAALEVRVRRRGGPWSPWVPLGAGHDHRPDTGTGAHASDPVWAGGADELQLRVPHGSRAAVKRALRVHFVAVPAAAKRRGARAAIAAAHAAQAAGGGAQPAIIPRSGWGGDGVKPRAAPDFGDVQVAFVHHTVSANDYAPTDSPGIVLSMAKYHRDVNGWNDLGYNFVVDKYGQIFEGRAGGIDQAVIGAQAQGYNSHSTGIANIGTFTGVGQTDAALDAMARLIAWKLPLHGAPVTGEVVLTSAGGDTNRYRSGTPVTLQRISGHRDGDQTECPGDMLYAQLPELRRRTTAIAPAVTPAAAVAIALDGLAKDVVYGDDLTVSGTIRQADGTPIAGRRVLVQKQGKSGWVTVARADTDDAGAWTANATWRAAGKVRARVTVPGSGTTATSGIQVGCTPLLTAKATTTRVKAGRALTVSGSIHPIAPVSVKVEQQGKDGRWRTIRTQKVTPKTAKFTARVPLSKPGLYRVTPHTGSGKAKASAAALYVRAVRKTSSLSSRSGAGSTPAPGPGPGGTPA
ncbi:MAG TPA: N-acetylmuramoyl-L-alanine amidase [Baekduia sp.]|uniref:N-acetylmuramoyl-L-alanine amidase n=1 Tax=Baekduia sp. TaxID=2600305 RepID=UPI002D79118B|nr:N-acetylmuramoyl-L-alanine amidase [Baekduia sp.]HET6506624.1 N-acetylmuramoyl-L-alanine amidase [Baekduia sp.]